MDQTIATWRSAMFKRLLLAPLILSVTGLLSATDSTFARPSGHGGGHAGGSRGGGHVAAGHVGGARGGAARPGAARSVGGGLSRAGVGRDGGRVGAGYERGAGYGGYRGGYGRFWPGYYPGFFGAYDPWYDADGWDFPYVGDADDFNAPAAPYYAAPASPPNPAAVAAAVRVIVPDPQARLWFDGQRIEQSGTDRRYQTPPLPPGTTYHYQVRAAWMQGGREVAKERDVRVTPGQTTVVDFAH
jgi:uncharacterized protein (TIGR03000 family)